MTTTALLQSQKNDVFRAIQTAGMAPTEFEWSTRESRHDKSTQVPSLVHTPTGYVFIFDLNPANNFRYCWYSPYGEFHDVGYGLNKVNWPSVMSVVEDWIKALQQEYSEPDLWQLTLAEKQLVVSSLEDLDNTQFSAAEQARISLALEQLQSRLAATGEHSAVQLKFIESRLNHLEEASRRLGRKDWITFAMGTLTNIILGAAFSPDAARELLRNAGSLLGWITSGIHLLQ